MLTFTTKDDTRIQTVHREADRDAVNRKIGDGKDLLGSLVALGAGIAFGLVLAVCFLEGQREGSASAEIAGSSLAKQNAVPGDESVRSLCAIVPDKEVGSVACQMGDQLWPDPNTD
jgi:hypothetical protein